MARLLSNKSFGIIISIFTLFALSFISAMLIGNFLIYYDENLILSRLNLHMYTFVYMFGLGMISFIIGYLLKMMMEKDKKLKKKRR